jgi:hypothetical protein
MNYYERLLSFYYFCEFSVLFFNVINMLGGICMFSFYIQNTNKMNNNTIIENCDNIYLLDFLGFVNSLFVFLIVANIFEIKILSFISNLIISCYNYYHIHKITQTCITYYSNTTDNINYISIYYLYNIFVQSITNLILIINICIFIRWCNQKKPKITNTETSNLITPTNTNTNYTYPQIDDYDTENLYDDMNN